MGRQGAANPRHGDRAHHQYRAHAVSPRPSLSAVIGLRSCTGAFAAALLLLALGVPVRAAPPLLPWACVVEPGQQWLHEGRLYTVIRVERGEGFDAAVYFAGKALPEMAAAMCRPGGWTQIGRAHV